MLLKTLAFLVFLTTLTGTVYSEGKKPPQKEFYSCDSLFNMVVDYDEWGGLGEGALFDNQ